MAKLQIKKPVYNVKHFVDCFPGTHLFVSLPPDDVEAGPIHFPGELTKVWGALMERQRFNWSSFFTVNEFIGVRRVNKDIKMCRAVFIDDDNPRDSHRTDFPLEPSIIVRSSESKYHYYWLTRTENFKEWEGVMERMVTAYGADKGSKDLARILRLPNTFNSKYNPPVECSIVALSGTVYDWDTIVESFPPVYSTVSSDSCGAPSDFNLIETMQEFMDGVSISPSLNSLIIHWAWHYSADKTEELVNEMFKQVPDDHYREHIKRYEYARSQIGKFIKTAKKTVADQKRDSAQVVQMSSVQTGIPESMEWDWSSLKSNPIPEKSIPPVLLNAAKEIGDWTATGQDPAILSGVFITSALLCKNILIHEIGDDLTTHCQCGIMIVMDTGGRKSAVYEHMNAPFFEFERHLKEEWDKEKHNSMALAALYDKDIKKLTKSYEKQKDPTDQERLAFSLQQGKLLQKRQDIQLKQPWLRTSDVTEEKLVRKLYENSGTIAIISDDARQAVNNMRGRYSNGQSGESVYVNALTGSDIIYERVNTEEEIHIERPVLNALLFVQPDAALSLKNSEMYVPSGLAARLPMYFYPISGVDIVRNTKRREVDKRKLEPYYECLRKLCVRRFDNPLHVRLTANGVEACRRMDQELADLLEKSWHGHYDKINKIITVTMMYATIFAALDDPGFALVYQDSRLEGGYTLKTKYLNMAFEFSKAVFSQTIYSHEAIKYESLPRYASSFLQTLRRWYKSRKIYEGFVNAGDFRNHVSTSYREMLPEILDFLLKKKWLYQAPMSDSKRKLNGGFPNKLVDTGDLIYHLNVQGIKERESQGLDSLETSIISS